MKRFLFITIFKTQRFARWNKKEGFESKVGLKKH